MENYKLTKSRAFDIIGFIMTPIVDTRKLKLLTAVENIISHTWNLLYSYENVKNYHQFRYYDTFASLDELKVFCDLHFPEVKLKVETCDEWWYNYFLVNKFHCL